MANEIRVVSRRKQRHGFEATVLFLHVLDPVLVTVGGGKVIVPTPASSLPDEASETDILEPGVLAALDTGAGAFEVRTIFLTDEEANDLPGAAVPKLQQQYAASTFVEDLRFTYKHTGRKIGAT
jgi:hypothetical protein